jgi:hypothetical protein
MWYHRLFDSGKTALISNDGFVVSVEGDDPLFDQNKTKSFLENIGGQNLEVI